MTKYLQRFSFSVSFYNKETHEQLIQANGFLNSRSNKQEYIDFYKNNPESVKVQHDYLTNRMSGMAHFIGDLFKIAIGKYELKNTAIINFSLNNDPKSSDHFVLGDYVNFCGMINRFYDWPRFLLIDDHEKRISLLDFIYDSLRLYTSKFKLDDKPIIQAYNSLKETNLSYVGEKHLYLKRNVFKLYKIYTYNFETVIWGILHVDLKSGEMRRINICEKKHYYGIEQPWLSIHDIMNIPMFLKYIGFDNAKNSYETSYGSENYSLNLETLKLTVF
jgi:hypothetical protein